MRNSSRVISAAIACALFAAIALAHGGGRDIHGTIVKIEKTALTIKRTDGKSETIPLVDATTYRVGHDAGGWSDMQIDSRVVVHAGHDGNAIEVDLPAKTP